MTGIASNAVADIAEISAKRWNAQLNCSFEPGPDRTTVRRDHSGPLSIQRPYYPEGKTAHVYMLHPPGGVVAYDSLQVNVQCEANASGLVSTPGAAKFYRSDGGLAQAQQTLLCSGGSLEWFPQENIFFNGCHARLRTTISVSSSTAFAWWEINCFGRRRGNAPFESGSVENTMELSVDSTLLLRDRLVVNDHHPLSTSCGLRGYSVSASLVLTPIHTEAIDKVRLLVLEQNGFSTTMFDNVLLIRYLGDSSEIAKNGFIRIWLGLRESFNGMAPQMPRIWAT